MAMIECKECGSNVSDVAPTCPQCGVSAPGGSCSVVFARPGIGGFAVGMEVFVAGQPFGVLKAKGRIVVPVAPGSHHFEIRTSQGKSASSTVLTSGGETVVNVALAFTGKPKFS